MHGHEPLADSRLVEQLRHGDDTAFEAIVRRYHAPLLTYVVGRLGSGDVAEDIIQDLFLRLWRSRQSLDPAGNLRAYLYASVRNHIKDHLRRERRGHIVFNTSEGAETAVVAEDDAILAAIDHSDLYQALTSALACLPDRCREVWSLSRDHGLSYEETARVMGVSVNTVKTQMGRAMRVLRKAAKPFLSMVLALG